MIIHTSVLLYHNDYNSQYIRHHCWFLVFRGSGFDIQLVYWRNSNFFFSQGESCWTQFFCGLNGFLSASVWKSNFQVLWLVFFRREGRRVFTNFTRVLAKKKVVENTKVHAINLYYIHRVGYTLFYRLYSYIFFWFGFFSSASNFYYFFGAVFFLPATFF